MVDVRTLPAGWEPEIAIALDELAREGARRMIAAALQAVADEFLARFADELDGRAWRTGARLAHGVLALADDLRDLRERVVEHIVKQQHGRQRHYRLANPHVAEVIDGVRAPGKPIVR
jgi:hypothetical protein